MRVSEMYAPTLREVPAEAEIPSHQLMLRAGMMRKTVSGVYSYLPLGYRTIRKIEQIVREEMDRQGGQEILMSAIQPAELWKETGRWEDYGNEMFRLKDRHGREFCLGPTHEEIFTALVRNEVRSYRQLPLLLYQIQTKYRDEIRPRFGLMRARDFIMKDLYSFDVDEKGLDVSYNKMYEAYSRAFKRCGLDIRAVEADVGTMGGSSSHEFVVLAETGEAEIVFCDKCGYAGNVERTEAVFTGKRPDPSLMKEMKVMDTPKAKTIKEVSELLGVEPSALVKTLIYVANGVPVAALIRGDRDLNEVKLKNHLKAVELNLADEEVIRRVTGAPVGFAGPVGLKGVRIIADKEIEGMLNFVTGANEADKHIVNVNIGRDFEADEIVDIRTVHAGDPCPKCSASLKGARGIEVGHIFKLGTKYSKALNATFLDANGEEHYMIMGCYGIGITRTMAAIIEASHDDDGIIWPMTVAPYHVIIVPVNPSEEEQRSAAERIYAELVGKGVEVVLDDRDERPGVKFKDADLIGYPIRITVGPKSLKEGKVEVKMRATGEQWLESVDEVAEKVKALIDEAIARCQPE